MLHKPSLYKMPSIGNFIFRKPLSIYLLQLRNINLLDSNKKLKDGLELRRSFVTFLGAHMLFWGPYANVPVDSGPT